MGAPFYICLAAAGPRPPQGRLLASQELVRGPGHPARGRQGFGGGAGTFHLSWGFPTIAAKDVVSGTVTAGLPHVRDSALKGRALSPPHMPLTLCDVVSGSKLFQSFFFPPFLDHSFGF